MDKLILVLQLRMTASCLAWKEIKDGEGRISPTLQEKKIKITTYLLMDKLLTIKIITDFINLLTKIRN